MNLFQSVKKEVTARQAAERYGIKVNRSGMACCPFHPDRNPSMKVDERFHCFGCGKDGDVIDFAAELYHLSKRDAAMKLATDFNIQYDDQSQTSPDHGQSPGRKISDWQRYETAERRLFKAYSEYEQLLIRWRKEYAPPNTAAEFHPLFVESLRNLIKVERILDVLTTGSIQERAGIIIEYGRSVDAIERKLGQFAAGGPADIDEHDRRDGTAAGHPGSAVPADTDQR